MSSSIHASMLRKFSITRLVLAFLLCGVVLADTTTSLETTLKDLDCIQFYNAVNDDARNESIPCRCVERSIVGIKGITIECSRSSESAISTALGTLNESAVGRVYMWDSHLEKISNDLLGLLKPSSLVIDRSRISTVEAGSFSQLGDRLKQLVIKKNKIQTLDQQLLKGLKRLRSLDLSGNQIVSIKKGAFRDTPDLEELIMDHNQISDIEEGAFEDLKNLKKLSLSFNSIQNITKNTFKGLESVERLLIQNNQLSAVDWSSINSLKQLTVLDVGSNHIETVNIQGLGKLKKIFLNGNDIENFQSINLSDLPSLALVSFDRNMLSEIKENDLKGLEKSTELSTFTVGSNNISNIDVRAFDPISHITVLGIQNNRLDSFSSEKGESFLRPLHKLQKLQASGNLLRTIKENDLPKTLTVLVADQNQLETIDAKAFEGIALRKLYINNNQLQYLPRHTFDSFTPDALEAVDVSGNSWQCVCGEEWLGWWLDKYSDKDVADGVIGCLAKPRCGVDLDSMDAEEKSTWVTIVAFILAVVSVLFLISIAFLYINDGRQKVVVMRPLTRRVDSDLHQLLADPLLKEDDSKRPLATTSGLVATGPVATNGDKKRVRFEK